MYALIRTGGKQYRVQPGDVLHVEKLPHDLGADVELTEVLAVGGDHPLIGTPLVSGAKVLVTITKQARTRKKLVFKKKRRHSYRKFQTHKQDFTEIFVKSITAPGGKILKADSEPSVKDMAAERLQRISDKQAARKARVEARIGQDEQTSQPERKKAVKKVVKKAAAKKKVATKKKSSSAKKKATKKVSKKA
jgi:large subunit ribosomal protein L21